VSVTADQPWAAGAQAQPARRVVPAALLERLEARGSKALQAIPDRQAHRVVVMAAASVAAQAVATLE
jgi:hypothetical protein